VACLSGRTAELYRGLLRNHITAWIGHLDLADVVPPTIRRWLRTLRDHGVSEVVMAKAYRFLHAVLTTAVEDGSIRGNPCTIKGAGQHEFDERPVVTLAQVFTLAETIQPRYRLVVLLVPEVEAHLAEFVGLSPDAPVFVGPKGAQPARSNFHTIWNKARQQAGVPDLHLHDLRHTGNTLAAETGATLRELMERMGHRSTRAALIYQHATSARDRSIATALSALVAADHPGPVVGPDDA
jgi:integrase